MVPKYIALNVIPKKIQPTAKIRATLVIGARSPYLWNKSEIIFPEKSPTLSPVEETNGKFQSLKIPASFAKI